MFWESETTSDTVGNQGTAHRTSLQASHEHEALVLASEAENLFRVLLYHISDIDSAPTPEAINIYNIRFPKAAHIRTSLTHILVHVAGEAMHDW